MNRNARFCLAKEIEMATKDEPVKLDPKIEFFKFDLKADKQRQQFADVFSKHQGKWPAIKSELTGKEGFTEATIKQLDFTHNLSVWSQNNAAVVSLFQKDEHTNSMRDIALSLNKTAFLEKVEAAAPAESEEKRRAFALNLRRDLFIVEPTAMLVNLIKDPQVPFLNDATGTNVAAVLTKQPDFNIKTTSVYELIKNETAFADISEDGR